MVLSINLSFCWSRLTQGCTLGPREQINQVTSFLDGSTIYGSSKEEAESLRTFSLGQLKVQYNDNYDELLGADLNSLDCRDSAVTGGKLRHVRADCRPADLPASISFQ